MSDKDNETKSKELIWTTELAPTKKEETEPVSAEELAGLRKQVTMLAETLEKMRLAEYIAYLSNPGRLLWFNFLIGLLRGLGTALGAGLLAGIAYYILKSIVILNLPVIGGFIAELSKYVNQP